MTSKHGNREFPSHRECSTAYLPLKTDNMDVATEVGSWVDLLLLLVGVELNVVGEAVGN